MSLLPRNATQRLARNKLKDDGRLTNEWALRLFAGEKPLYYREISCPLHHVLTYDFGQLALLAVRLYRISAIELPGVQPEAVSIIPDRGSEVSCAEAQKCLPRRPIVNAIRRAAILKLFGL